MKRVLSLSFLLTLTICIFGNSVSDILIKRGYEIYSDDGRYTILKIESVEKQHINYGNYRISNFGYPMFVCISETDSVGIEIWVSSISEITNKVHCFLYRNGYVSKTYNLSCKVVGKISREKNSYIGELYKLRLIPPIKYENGKPIGFDIDGWNDFVDGLVRYDCACFDIGGKLYNFDGDFQIRLKRERDNRVAEMKLIESWK